MQSKIELEKTRDLGETISDTLTFAKQNIKPLLKYVFTFCGIFMLLSIVVAIVQQFKFQDAFSTPFNNNLYSANSKFQMFGIEYFLLIFFLLLNYTTILVVVLCYLTLYKTKGNTEPTTEEMWAYIKFYIFKSLGITILLGILLVFAFIFCIVPGVYLSPIFGLILPVMIIENTTFGYAFNRSFILIKENWWLTFGCIVVISIITGIARTVFSLPVVAITFSTTLFHLVKGQLLSHVLIIISAVLSQFIQLLYIVPAITIGLCYFNLTETKDGVSLLDRISRLGEAAPNQNITDDEY